MPISVRSPKEQSSHPKGWTAVEEDTRSLRQRLANNTLLWVACLLAILLVSLALITFSGGKQADDTPEIKAMAPGTAKARSDFDAKSKDFLEKFVNMGNRRGDAIEAEFVSIDEFKLTIASDVGYDEIAYLSRFAALGIKKLFDNGAIVYAYTRDIKKPSIVRLTATTQWSMRENTFITKAERAMDAQ